METTSQLKTIFIEKIEDFLGSKISRYSSNGYKNVKFSLTNFQIGQNYISNNLSVIWPVNWAIKSSNTIKPHLGSIEYFAISAIMSELLLSITYNLTEDEISKSWIREFKFKAKARSEANHARYTVETTLKNTFAVTDSINGFVSCIDIRINGVEISIYIDHVWKDSYKSFPHSKFAELSNKIHNNYYNVGYKKQEHDIYNINVTPDQKKISADISVTNTFESNKFRGIGSFYRPEVVLTDFILTACQITQVLIYTLDNLNRNETNNLWLRELSVTYPKPLNKGFLKLYMHCEEFKSLFMKHETWRIAEIITKLGNIACTAKVAHKLPSPIAL